MPAEPARNFPDALFGDAAARTLGFAALGLSDRAGLALALADAANRSPHFIKYHDGTAPIA